VPEKVLFLCENKEVIMKIAIGTKNQAKVQAVEKVCATYLETYEFHVLSVPSNVSDQPIGDEETLLGAKNRALHALTESQADMSFGLEGGVKELNGQLFVCNWGILHTKNGQQFIAGGAQIPLPEEVAAAIRKGKELGPVMDEYTKQVGIRHKDGAVGVFTKGIVNRGDMFEHIVKLLIGQYFKANQTQKTT
jgi:inosine/xanthosine triphosphatase